MSVVSFPPVSNCRKLTLRPKIPQTPEVRALQPLAQVRVVPLPRPPPLWPVLFPSPSCSPNLAPSTHCQVSVPWGDSRSFWGAQAPQPLSRPQAFTVHIRPIHPGCGARVGAWDRRIAPKLNLRGASLLLIKRHSLSCSPRHLPTLLCSTGVLANRLREIQDKIMFMLMVTHKLVG